MWGKHGALSRNAVRYLCYVDHLASTDVIPRAADNE